MGTNKSEEFSVKDNRIARFAKALGHPARIAILKILIEKKSCICGEIVLELPLSQSTISQHLKELKEAGLIRGEIDGPKVCYCINAAEWELARKSILQLFDSFPPMPENCC